MIWGLEHSVVGMCVSAEQGWLHRGVTCAVAQGLALGRTPCFVSCSAVAILQFLIFFKQEALHFSFALGPTNFVAEICPDSQTSGSAPGWHAVLSTSSRSGLGSLVCDVGVPLPSREEHMLWCRWCGYLNPGSRYASLSDLSCGPGVGGVFSCHSPEEGRNILQLRSGKVVSKTHGIRHSAGETRCFSVTVLQLEIFTASKQRSANYSLWVDSGHSLVFTQRIKEEWFLHFETVRQIKRILFYDMLTSYAIWSAVSINQVLLEYKCPFFLCCLWLLLCSPLALLSSNDRN